MGSQIRCGPAGLWPPIFLTLLARGWRALGADADVVALNANGAVDRVHGCGVVHVEVGCG
jgi:hypothetical protein